VRSNGECQRGKTKSQWHKAIPHIIVFALLIAICLKGTIGSQASKDAWKHTVRKAIGKE
jgi:hypothetical protein